MVEPLRLLCVDDDEDIRTLLEISLKLDAGMDVRIVSDGHNALKLLVAHDWTPHAILLDARMPEIDGKLLLGEIRLVGHHASTPVLFLTADVNPAATAELMALGAHAVLAKPFDPLSLAADVRHALRN